MGRTDTGWLTATEVQGQVRRGEVSAQHAVDVQLDRIQRLDPRVHAYVHVDRHARAGQGPMAGVTISVKDTDPVRGQPWTAGSPRWRDRIAGHDSLQVRAARERGASILGKVNTPELAAAVGTVNTLFPPTENPWRPGYTPGGSSGGGGAAVAAGLCAISFGGDMGGSIRIPSSCCGVFGLRPSPYRVPSEEPEVTRLTVRGPLARSVNDLRMAFELMVGEVAPEPLRRPLSIVAVDHSPVAVDTECAAAMERAVEALTAAGHHVVRGGRWEPAPVAEAYRVVRPVTMAVVPGEASEYGPAVSAMIEEGRRTSGHEFLSALQGGVAAAAFVVEQLAGHDLLLTPTLGSLPMPIDEVPAFLQPGWDSYTQFVLPVSFAGLPAISVPAGLAGGLPVGIQLIGRFAREWPLLDVADQLSRQPGFGFRQPPGFD
jgi:amidase